MFLEGGTLGAVHAVYWSTKGASNNWCWTVLVPLSTRPTSIPQHLRRQKARLKQKSSNSACAMRHPYLKHKRWEPTWARMILVALAFKPLFGNPRDHLQETLKKSSKATSRLFQTLGGSARETDKLLPQCEVLCPFFLFMSCFSLPKKGSDEGHSERTDCQVFIRNRAPAKSN